MGRAQVDAGAEAQRRIGVIGVASSAGAHSIGLEKGPEHFRQAGLVPRLRDAGLEVVDFGDLGDERGRVLYRPDKANPRQRNLAAVVAVARSVAGRVESALRQRARPLVVGGDCTITVGALAGAVRLIGNLGVIYVDAQTDLNSPGTSRSGILDSMGMAHVIGLGAEELNRIGPRYPLLSQDKVLLFGFHPDKIYPAEHELLRRGEMLHCSATTMAGRVAEVAEEKLRRLAERVDAFLVHFDVDVISFVDFPVADVPLYHGSGLERIEAVEALARFVAHPKFAGLVVSEFRPDLDTDGTLVDQFVGDLVRVLSVGTALWTAPPEAVRAWQSPAVDPASLPGEGTD